MMGTINGLSVAFVLPYLFTPSRAKVTFGRYDNCHWNTRK